MLADEIGMNGVCVYHSFLFLTFIFLEDGVCSCRVILGVCGCWIEKNRCRVRCAFVCVFFVGGVWFERVASSVCSGVSMFGMFSF